jgi:hypothetical protein
MKKATELLKAYLAEIQDPAATAALFADDGVVELPTVNASTGRASPPPCHVFQRIASLGEYCL